jgi:hypothetical protein
MFFFGGFSTDLWSFTSLVGLSISLNRGVCKPPVVQSAREEALPESLLATSAA